MDDASDLTIGFSFAFQPIVNIETGTITSYEALVRGRNNESAAEVFNSVSGNDRQVFDNRLRLAAISLATELGIQCDLNLNILPSSLQTSDACIVDTLAMAERCGLTPDRITLEITEGEIISDVARFAETLNIHRGSGVKVSIDDFGAGYAGLNLLADFQPDSIKLDMSMVRNIDRSGPRQAIVRGIARTCLDLGIDIIAEGVESHEEFWWLRAEDVELFQGYLFAKPGFRHLPMAFYPSR